MKTNTLGKLYKEAKKGGKIQVWWLEVEGNKFRSHEGFVDGTISIGSWVTCEGKNIGKANETSPEAQAVLEAAARIQKKKDKGYTEDINSCCRPFEPTLAHVLEDYKDKVTFPALLSWKLDGIRCLYRNGKLYSRNNKEIVSCPHIVKEIEELGISHLNLDGELYNHDLKNDFNKIISLTRQTKPTQEDLERAAETIQYHIFDYVAEDDFPTRFNNIKKLIEYSPKRKKILFVPHFEVNSWEDVETRNKKNVEWGYEGSMIRWGNDPYHNGRTKYLLKMKTFQDIEAPVVAILEGRGKRADTVGKWVLSLPDGRTFEASPTGTDEENKKIWLDKASFIGKLATIKFQDYTPDGIPRFPTFLTIRDYE